jgi:hypothetical protein
MSQNITVLHVEIGKGRQDVNYSETLRIGDRKFRVRIKSDSYDFQCYARIEALDQAELKWNVVASIHHSAMKTRDGLAYVPNNSWNTPKWFKEDRDNLIDQVQDLLA